MRTHIINNENFKIKAGNAISLIANSMANSIGPCASWTIMQDNDIITKDGFTILKHMKFDDPVYFTIHRLLVKISREMVNEVGDGSTSCILAAEQLFYELDNYAKSNDMRTKEILDSLNEIIDEIIKELKERAIPVSDNFDELEKIASVSLNNNVQVGKVIADAYRQCGKETFLHVKLNPKDDETYYDSVKGFKLDFGFLDKILINTKDGNCYQEDAKIIMFDSGLHDDSFMEVLDKILVYATTTSTFITIIAPSYGKNISNYLRFTTQRLLQSRQPLMYNIIALPNSSESESDLFEDLAIKTGTNIIRLSLGDLDKYNFSNIDDLEKVLGSCDSITSSDTNTIIIGAKGNQQIIDARIGDIKNTLTKTIEQNLDLERYRCEKRLSILQDKLVTLYVGGKTEDEKATNKALIDDAVSACRVALKSGYVEGNHATTLNILNDYKDNDMANLIVESLYNVIDHILNNANSKIYNNRHTIKKLVSEKGIAYNILDDENPQVQGVIINPVETEIEILKNVSSIIGLLVLSNQFISVNMETQI